MERTPVGDPEPVTICGVPYTFQRIEGGVIFSEKSGFWGHSLRVVFSYQSMLWRLEEATGKVALCHLVRMAQIIDERVHGDHAEANAR